MASFSDAPTEVTDQILSYVPASDLYNVCLVNKALKRSAEPFLYSAVSFQWDHHSVPRVAPLLRTLLRRPELLDYLDTVTLQGHLFTQRNPPPPINISNNFVDEFIAAIEKTGVAFASMWVDRLRSPNTCMYAMVALLIAKLPNTTHLTVGHPYINGQSLVPKVLGAKIFGQLPAFERLEELRYLKRCDISSFDNNHIFSDTINLFYLPTVTHIEVSMTNPQVFQWPAGEPNLDHLTSLKIGWLTEDFLAKIFARTRNLRSLHWTWEHHGDRFGPWETTVLDFQKIMGVLESLKASLEKLTLELYLGLDDELADNLRMTVEGNLRHLRYFPRITHLDVPLTSRSAANSDPLPLADYAPANIEVLTLSGSALVDDECPHGWDGWVERAEFKDLVPLIKDLANPYRPRGLQRVEIIDDHGGNIRRAIGGQIEGLDLGFRVEII
ncbi:unnamed protein product [Clonostachys byssicola]|uniref:F-box domain-containing protein n=1 Tax=Clonostachys byssicola TaxID=160290 RepID=A0A9N9UTU9_9HYPO|nr:unnamed protein product [Clonostachys byssicola]